MPKETKTTLSKLYKEAKRKKGSLIRRRCNNTCTSTCKGYCKNSGCGSTAYSATTKNAI